MNIDLLSQRSENTLLKTIISAAAIDPSPAATKKGGLNATENAGCLTHMSRAEFLALMVYTDLMVCNKDFEELKRYFIEFCQQQEWCDFDLVHIDRRIEGMAVNAILELTPNLKNRPSTIQKAKHCGCSTTAYHKKWAVHQAQLNQQGQHWLITAAQVLHHNSANG